MKIFSSLDCIECFSKSRMIPPVIACFNMALVQRCFPENRQNWCLFCYLYLWNLLPFKSCLHCFSSLGLPLTIVSLRSWRILEACIKQMLHSYVSSNFHAQLQRQGIGINHSAQFSSKNNPGYNYQKIHLKNISRKIYSRYLAENQLKDPWSMEFHDSFAIFHIGFTISMKNP